MKEMPAFFMTVHAKKLFNHHSLCVNVLLQVDDGEHVLLEQALVLHLLCHYSEEVDGVDIHVKEGVLPPVQPLLLLQGLVKMQFTWWNCVLQLDYLIAISFQTHFTDDSPHVYLGSKRHVSSWDQNKPGGTASSTFTI